MTISAETKTEQDTTSEQVKPSDLRHPLLVAFLDHAAFDGWTVTAFERAAEDIGITKEFAELAFPGGPKEVLAYHLQDADRRLQEALNTIKLNEMRIQDRIKTAIRLRLEQNTPYRHAIQRAMGKLALPENATLGIKALEDTMDLIWTAAGDTSTDLNWYSKRLTLSAVYMSVLTFWLTDESDDFMDTWTFLDRRIDNVMAIEKAKWKIKEKTKNLPNPFKKLGEIRFGN